MTLSPMADHPIHQIAEVIGTRGGLRPKLLQPVLLQLSWAGI